MPAELQPLVDGIESTYLLPLPHFYRLNTGHVHNIFTEQAAVAAENGVQKVCACLHAWH
jgi:hypothetical protein